jgi:hypothetical protein
MRKKMWRATLVVSAMAAALLPITIQPAQANAPVSGAVFTTVDPDVDNSGHCLNGGPGADAGLVNCNIYDDKQNVWLSGGPDGNQPALADGTYVFAVLDPGGQGDANDGADENLSDLAPTTITGAGDDWTNRVFTVSGGEISYGGTTHTFDNAFTQSQYGKIRLFGYDNTTNLGGVYILSVCNLADATDTENPPVDGDGPGVSASDCKYDAFKVVGEGTPPAKDLTIEKTAAASFDRQYFWKISKSVDKTLVKQVGGTATFNYTATADLASPASQDGNWKVKGKITVSNPNAFDVGGVDVTDEIDNNGTCTVTNGTDITVPGNGHVELDYTCTYTSTPTPSSGDNTGIAEWFEGSLKHISSTAPYDFSSATITKIDDCVTVTDSFNGGTSATLGTACVSDTLPKSFNYPKTVNVPAFDCTSYNNTATFTTNGTGATGSASQTVTVCGPAKTGALTIGYWQNKNGQSIITKGASTASVCNSATWLRQYVPFQDLSATATCAQVGTYVTNVIKAANASGAAMNAMLKAQMLATALDVYFSDAALGGNKIGAPAPIGGVAIDLTKICKMIDGSSGSATCGNVYQNASSAFGGATSLTVSQILAYAASQSNVGGTAWYGQVKATQELAKNTFDAINNQVAFAP